MARLKQKNAPPVYELSAETIVGRASGATVRLTQPYVSSHHASVRWTERHYWELRDLQSKNGTYVNGARVGHGAKVKLESKDEIGFGSTSDTYVVEDVSAPRPMLMAVDAELSPIFLDQTMLALPSSDQPDITLFQAATGHWQIESRDRAGPIRDGDLLSIGSQQWRCCLPTIPDETEALANLPDLSALADVEIAFDVSRDQERVDVTLHMSGRSVPLGSKACFYLLLVLGRCRLQRDLPPSAEVSADGWIGVNALLELLRVTEQRLNVDIFRIRQELRSAGIVDAAGIVERQPQRRLLRLGTRRVTFPGAGSGGGAAGAEGLTARGGESAAAHSLWQTGTRDDE
jgi:hypothetical protein